MMEVDLPRMQSLSPHFDSPATIDIPGMTNLTEMMLPAEPELNPSNFSMEDTKNGDWKFETGICGCNKSGCGCKYINKESEIVEVLWKQDVDLGYTLAPVKAQSPKESVNVSGPSFNTEDNEKLKALQELKNDKHKPEEPKLDDEWAGINFTVDNETGEYIQLPLQLEEILQDVLQLADLANENNQVDEILAEELKKSEYSDVNGESSSVATASTSTSNQFDTNFAFPTEKLTTEQKDNKPSTSDIHGSELQLLLDPPLTEEEISADLSAIINEANDLDELDMMIQSAGPFQHPRTVAQNYGHANTNMYHRQSSYHSHHHQSRLRAMEQRGLDILPFLPGMGVGMNVTDMGSYSHYPSHYPYQGASSLPQHDQYGGHQHMAVHNVSTGDMGANQPISSIGPLSTQRQHYATPNLGSAVSSSMHLTNSSHDSDVLGATSNYKTEHDMMYYSNTSSELNHTTDGFINSMLGYDDELLLNASLDMGPVTDGFYTMRMLEPNATSNNSSVLSAQANAAAAAAAVAAAGSLNNNGAGLLPNATGAAPQMQTTLNGNTATSDRLDASSDSAVSSMGSERVPSLSDGEWGDTGSDSAQEYHHSKYGAYDYRSYNGRLNDAVRHPVAQKKHQMFGKRYLQDQSASNLNISQSASNGGVVQPQQADMPIKYEYEPYPMHHPLATNLDGAAGGMPIMNKHQSQQQCSIDFGRHNPRGIHDIVGHNHTYTLPQASGATPRSQPRDKKNSKKTEDEHLTRDEKRARQLNVPIAVIDIINLPMDEFNERLSKYDLSENQLTLIRDIRRRGKNKVAAQNCRKRKLDQILMLADEVDEVRKRKERLVKEQAAALAEQNRIKKKFSDLYTHIFQHLRDPQGNLYSQSEYNLQQSADGRVLLLPRDNHNSNQVNLQMQHNVQQQQSNQQQQQQQQQQPTNSTHHISHHHNPRH
ncbi:segmentation protein cap'n'collar isoform X2 [Contarinia nasturtii]|uniref:segmentation protein cap'n'collar isoform X2 n=1 Tax=Contarinia nasturtii TaxID=265458 RepID=UPI0012D451CA|nr:segmentation protein cap'n'collar isoform X2 [Contarinia nasturtii]